MKAVVARSNLIYVCLIIIGLVLTGQSSAEIDPGTIVGIWFLDDGSGKSAKDSSGNGYDGELMKEAKWVEGGFGKAVEFDGVDDRVDCGDVDALDRENASAYPALSRWG